MPTTRFCCADRRARADLAPPAGPGPRRAAGRRARGRGRPGTGSADAARRHALAHPAWGHRKVWAMCRHDGHRVSAGHRAAAAARGGAAAGGELPAGTPPARRPAQGGVRRPSRPGRTRCGSWTSPSSRPPPAEPGGWPAAGTTGRKYELGWHVSPTANQHDAIAAVELALAEAERLAGRPLVELAARDAERRTSLPLVTIVTDNGGPFRSFRFEAFIATHPELRHVRTRVRRPRGRTAHANAASGTLKYERLFLEEIDDALDLLAARRGLPGRVQHRPPARGPRLEPAPRRPPRPGRPADPQLSRDRNPANCLTRDTRLKGDCVVGV